MGEGGGAGYLCDMRMYMRLRVILCMNVTVCDYVCDWALSLYLCGGGRGGDKGRPKSAQQRRGQSTSEVWRQSSAASMNQQRNLAVGHRQIRKVGVK